MFRNNYKNLFKIEREPGKKRPEGLAFPWAGTATPQCFSLAFMLGKSFRAALPALGKP